MPALPNDLIIAGLDSVSTARDIVPITPDDNNDLATTARDIRCDVGGTIRITTYSGNVRNTRISDGAFLNCMVQRVHATGTTATGLEAFI